jgi:SAM-dependent methyltransferase
MFSDYGFLPIYRVLRQVDSSIFSERTIWEGQLREGAEFLYQPGCKPGRQFIAEATELRGIDDSTYECILAARCLEHVANPFKALQEWRRVLKPDGVLVLDLPHKDGTFDWRRPVTSLSHMTEDYNNGIGEDDLTHLAEVLALHDLTKDKPAGPAQQFRKRCLENFRYRALHHHVFDTWTVVAMVDCAKFQVLQVDTVKPCHIVILACRCEGIPQNAQFLGPAALYRRSSPFLSDALPGILS